MLYFNLSDNGFTFNHSIDEKPDQSNFSMHTHEHYEILIFLTGNCKYIVEGNEYDLSPGNIIITRGCESHYLKVKGNSPYERMVFHFEKEHIAKPLNSEILLEPFENRVLGKQNCYNPYVLNKFVIDNLISRIINVETDGNSTEELKTVVFLSLYQLLYEIKEGFKSHSSVSADNSDNLIVSIVSYINQNISEPLCLKQLSEHFYISKSHLTEQFKHYTGSTVWEYINTKRLLLAKKMLKDGFGTDDVLNECGFNDYSTFYRRYKDYFGVSPSLDKRMIQ